MACPRKLPTRVFPKAFYPNSVVQNRRADSTTPTLATLGAGLSIDAAPLPVTYKAVETNIPAAFVELIAPDASLGT